MLSEIKLNPVGIVDIEEGRFFLSIKENTGRR